ncbi:hypothetical protein F5148DRAFT_1351913 [Russula earlei]|uniref:Uncharacterized protein n=1 Tax=Russula earlei TaxID=71964 RepID=A0ACC0UMJ5_9AGAM|nr:hypothetical protein F5148DRAFT_1351913 [Russula earlei]
MSEYETTAAIIETETSTPQEIRNRATLERIAAKEAALIAEVPVFLPRSSLAQPLPPSGVLGAGATTTAARAEAEQATPEGAREVHETAERAKGVAEHAASTAKTRGPGVTGNAYDAVTQLRAKMDETTDAAVAEGQKNVQAAVDAGANYFEQAKGLASSASAKMEETTVAAVAGGQKNVQAAVNAGANYLEQAKGFASSAISTAASYLPASLRGTGGEAGSVAESASASPDKKGSSGGVPATSAPGRVDHTQ